jgi:hypothetical protein
LGGSRVGPGSQHVRTLKKPARIVMRAGFALLGRRCCYEVRRAMKDARLT